MTTRKKLFENDPDAFEWPCNMCGKPFKPSVWIMPDGKRKHAPRCEPCAHKALIAAIFTGDASKLIE